MNRIVTCFLQKFCYLLLTVLPQVSFAVTSIDDDQSKVDDSPFIYLGGQWQKASLIEFQYNPEGQPEELNDIDIAGLLINAAAQWNKVTNLNLSFTGFTDQPCEKGDGLNTICWEPEEQVDQTLEGNYAAFARISNSGIWITEGDIHYNPRTVYRIVSESMFLGLALHEMGHVIGLGHEPDNPSVMNTTASFTTLQEDDIAGAGALYPPVQSTLLRDIHFSDANFNRCIQEETVRKYWVESDDVDVIECESRGIYSVIGIDKFKKLQLLYLRDNEITNIDVSANKNLLLFSASGNKLTALDFSENKQITAIVIYDNPLKSLNLSQNRELEALYISRSRFSTLDLTSNTKLKGLYTHFDQFRKVLFPENSALEKVTITNTKRLRHLDTSLLPNAVDIDVSGNSLTEINLSLSPKLKTLDVAQNDLTMLDLSGNPLLLSVLAHSNKISRIDLLQNDRLQELNLYKNRLQNITFSENSKLTSLQLGRNRFVDIDLGNLKDIQYLTLSENGLSYIDLSANTQLLGVYMNQTELREIDLAALEALELFSAYDNRLVNINFDGNPALKEFRLRWNPVSQETYDYLRNLSDELGINDFETLPTDFFGAEVARSSNYETHINRKSLDIPCLEIISSMNPGRQALQVSAKLHFKDGIFTVQQAMKINGIEQCSGKFDLDTGVFEDKVYLDFNSQKQRTFVLKATPEGAFIGAGGWQSY